MNYEKIRNDIIDSLDFNECCIRKTKIISKLKAKLKLEPMNLADISERRLELQQMIKPRHDSTS